MAKRSPRPTSNRSPVDLRDTESVLVKARQFAQGQEALAMTLGRWENGFIRESGPYLPGDGGYLVSRIVGPQLVHVSAKISALHVLGHPLISDPGLLGMVAAYGANVWGQEAQALERLERLGDKMPKLPTVQKLRREVSAALGHIQAATNPVHLRLDDRLIQQALKDNLSTFRQPIRPPSLSNRGIFVLMPGNVQIHRTSMDVDSRDRRILQDFALDTRNRIVAATGEHAAAMRTEAGQEAKVMLLGALVSPSDTPKVQSVKAVLGVSFGSGRLRAVKIDTLALDSTMLGRRLSTLIGSALSQRMTLVPAQPWEPLEESPKHVTTDLYVTDLKAWAESKYGDLDALFDLYAQGAFQDTIKTISKPYEPSL